MIQINIVYSVAYKCSVAAHWIEEQYCNSKLRTFVEGKDPSRKGMTEGEWQIRKIIEGID